MRRAAGSAGRSGAVARRAVGEGRRSRAMAMRAGRVMVGPSMVQVFSEEGPQTMPPARVLKRTEASGAAGFPQTRQVANCAAYPAEARADLRKATIARGALRSAQELQGGFEFVEELFVRVVRVDEHGGDLRGEHRGIKAGEIGAKLRAVIDEIPAGECSEFARAWDDRGFGGDEDDFAGGEQIERAGHSVFFGLAFRAFGDERQQAVAACEEADDLGRFGKVGHAETDGIIGEVGGHEKIIRGASEKMWQMWHGRPRP